MISKISLKNFASYAEEVEVTPNKINYFYGSNGSGKTSLTKVLHDVSLFKDCNITWKTSQSREILVYNRDFVRNNFSQSSTIKGIFTLGNDSSKSKELIEKTKQEVEELKVNVEGYIKTLKLKVSDTEKLENTFQEKCWAVKDKFSESFREAYSGFLGSKKIFAQKCMSETSNSSASLPYDVLVKKYNVLFKNNSKSFDPIKELDLLDLPSVEKYESLSKSIVGKEDLEIGELINHLKNGDWIKNGLEYLSESEPKCPFCQQEINKDFRIQIEGFFDENYKSKCDELRQFGIKYFNYFDEKLKEVKSLFTKGIDILNFSELELKVKLIDEKFKSNLNQIKSKINSPSIKVELESLEDLFNQVQAIVLAFKNEVDAHNKIITNRVKEKKQLISEIWRFIADNLATEIKTYNSSLQGIHRAQQNLNNSKSTKEAEIQKKQNIIRLEEEKITSTVHTVNEINKILSLFGFNNFRISEAAEKGFYKIVRDNGEDAKETLSEGEYTFITFLYFFQLIKGSNESTGIIRDKVVVIDDPISSLDSSVIFIVSHLVKEVINDCRENKNGVKQILIFTHNIYFHKEVTFRGSREGKLKEESYWTVRKLNGNSSITLHDSNPIQTTYELLWRELDDTSKINKVTIFNTLRRILEYYFNIIGGIDYEKCIQEFEGEEKLICKALLSWINDGSHFVNDDLILDVEPDIIEKYIIVFKSIFDKMGHLSHYNMMKKVQNDTIIDTTTNEDLKLDEAVKLVN